MMWKQVLHQVWELFFLLCHPQTYWCVVVELNLVKLRTFLLSSMSHAEFYFSHWRISTWTIECTIYILDNYPFSQNSLCHLGALKNKQLAMMRCSWIYTVHMFNLFSDDVIIYGEFTKFDLGRIRKTKLLNKVSLHGKTCCLRRAYVSLVVRHLADVWLCERRSNVWWYRASDNVRATILQQVFLGLPCTICFYFNPKITFPLMTLNKFESCWPSFLWHC